MNLKTFFLSLLCLSSISMAQDVPLRDNSPTKYKFAPVSAPSKTGEVIVAVVPIIFKETELHDSSEVFKKKLNTFDGKTMEEYFKIYSNNIAWPKLVLLPSENKQDFYVDSQFYGYYCPYKFWENPVGYKGKDEGMKRVSELKARAIKHCKGKTKISKWDALSFNYITTRKSDDKLKELITPMYTQRNANIKDRKELRRLERLRRKEKKSEQQHDEKEVWKYYAPGPAWGDPLWPNSSIQMNDASAGTFAHELGHVLGAPDVYRIGPMNDGIGGSATAISYGPTANAFSRFYHHGYVQAKNYPLVNSSGTYTLHPRHINPKGNEQLGMVIPSNHPHYFYHVEYVYDGGSELRCGGENPEGLLISVINFNLQSYLGSPDYFYTYRPGDPFFRGAGDYSQAIFGEQYGRTEFSMETEPSSRLPNLLDGGISISNIKENKGTLTFDLNLEKNKISGAIYQQSLLPQILLKKPREVQPTRFVLDAEIKFRGEPYKIDYGFCWGTSKMPTVKNAYYVLSHREFYSGHAINLQPKTTYYVRAWARNALGIRYSDEEFTVKTPEIKSTQDSVEPLLLDQFSHNSLLVNEFGNDDYQNLDGFTPTAVLAKLIAYYRPERTEKDISKGAPKDQAFKYGLINWNPSLEQIAWRQEGSRQLFKYCYNKAGEAGMKGNKPQKSLLRDLTKALNLTEKPNLLLCGTANNIQVEETVKEELRMSRPVILLYYDTTEGSTNQMQWALIDGFNPDGEFHVDLPSAAGFTEMKSGSFRYDALPYAGWQHAVITNIHLLK